MIKINLLPEALKKAQKPEKKPLGLKMPKLGPQVFKCAGIFAAVLAGLHILLILSIFLKGISVSGLESKWQALQPARIDAERLNAEIASIEKKISPVRQLIENRFLWSKKMSQLSDLMTPGIWLKRLFLEIQLKNAATGEYAQGLNMEGSAASLYGDETGLVGRFVKALQDDEGFSADFSEVKLGPMERGIIDKTAVMNFRVFCFLKKGALTK